MAWWSADTWNSDSKAEWETAVTAPAGDESKWRETLPEETPAAVVSASANWWEAPQTWSAPETPAQTWSAPETPAQTWSAPETPAVADWGAATTEQWQAPAPKGDSFWEMQQWYKSSGQLSKKEDWEFDAEESKAFAERLGSNSGIDFDLYASVPVRVSGDKSEHIPVCYSFEELYSEFKDMIPESLIQNVRRCCYKCPTPVQKYAIPVGLAGRDVMCCAQTGSGKTAAFLFPIIGTMLKYHHSPTGLLTTPFEGKCSPYTLIMTPTRELCVQIYEEALKFCHRTPYRSVKVYGGAPPKGQMEDLSRGADLMVACPGRLQDFIDRGVVSVESVLVLVLDEADRMLDMGFEPQIRKIVEQNGMASKDSRQTMMFSATFAEECQKLAGDFLYNYIWIGVGVVGGAVETVDQQLIQVTPAEKYETLIQQLDEFYSVRQEARDGLKERCLVFVNAKDTAKFLDEQLYIKNMNSGTLHGNLTQDERERNLARFRSGEIDVMVATDVAARGLDIEHVSRVINYDMPKQIDSYVHRIGRTGRIGNKGTAITFIAVDAYGGSLEDRGALTDLLRVMKDAGSDIPPWLEGMVPAEGGGSEAVAWGGKDMRGSWGNEQSWTGSGW